MRLSPHSAQAVPKAQNDREGWSEHELLTQLRVGPTSVLPTGCLGTARREPLLPTAVSLSSMTFLILVRNRT